MFPPFDFSTKSRHWVFPLIRIPLDFILSTKGFTRRQISGKITFPFDKYVFNYIYIEEEEKRDGRKRICIF